MSLTKSAAKRFSQVLANSPEALFRFQEAWLKLGYKIFDLEMAQWVIRRPEWLRVKPAPAAKRLLTAEFQPDDASIEIARRSAEMVRQINQHGQDRGEGKSEIWDGISGHYMSELMSLVESSDVQGLAKYQAKIFQKSAVNGFAYGSTFDSWPHRWNYLPVQIELSVLQLAEMLGVHRLESPEQGKKAYWREYQSEHDLIASIEAALGVRVEQPKVGSPRGIEFGGRFITRETCPHLMTACRIRDLLVRESITQPLRVVEIGGGYGGLAYWLRALLGDRVERYAIVDLPETLIVQSAFLGKTHHGVSLWGEEVDNKVCPYELVPHFALDSITFTPNLIVNQDSFPEMPESEVRKYVEWAAQNLDGLFFSCNQEAVDEGSGFSQVWASSILRNVPGLKLLSRDLAWDRRGYVEEVYRATRD